MISTPLRFTPFTGRDSELKFLRDVHARACEGMGAAVAIVGDAGLGKTRLIDEHRANAGAVLLGACSQYAKTTLRPFREMLGLPPTLREMLTGLGLGDEEPTAEARKALVVDGILLRIRNLCESARPLTLVIEDSQWADEATLHVITDLVLLARSQPLVVIVALRYDGLRRNAPMPALSTLTRHGGHAIYLEPLTRGEVRYLIRSAVEEAALSNAEIERIEDLASGNPLYLEELLRAALDERRHPRTDAERIPVSIGAAVTERFSRLPAGTRALLLDAAVLGEHFDIDLLAGIHGGRKRHPTQDALQRAVDTGFLVECADSGDLRFRHPLIREVLYARLTSQSRRRLHEMAARALSGRGSSHDHVRELAYHWSGADDAPMALEYNDAAGAAALSDSMYRDAARHFRRALDFSADDNTRRWQIKGRLAMALYGDGELGEAKPLFREAIEGALDGERFDEAATLIDVLFTAYWYDSDTAGGLSLVSLVIERAECGLDPDSRDTILVRAFRFLSILAASGHEGAQDGLERLATFASPAAIPSKISWHEIRGINFAQTGDFVAALTELREALRLAREHDLPAAVVRVAGNLATCHQLVCDLVEAERVVAFALAFEDERELGVVQRCGSLLQRADLLAQMGRLGEAADAMEHALAAGADYGQMRTLCAGIGIPIALATGRAGLLSRCADEEVIHLALSARRGTDIALIGIGFGRLFVEQGRTSEAQDLLRAAVETSANSQFSLDMLVVAARFGHEGELERVASALTSLCKRRPYHVRSAYTALLGAVTAQRRGDWSLRKRLAREAAAAFNMLGMRLYEAQALEIAGLQVQARRLYEEIGALCDAARLAAVFADRGDRGKLLTRRQSEIATLVASGESNRLVARRLQLSEKTLEHHLTAIYRRLGVRSRQALQAALDNDCTPYPAPGIPHSRAGSRLVESG